MTLKTFVMIWLLAPLSLLARQKGFTITGTVSGLSDNSKVSLIDVNNSADTLAKAAVKDGSFVLSGNISEPNLYQLNFGDPNKKSILFIGNENITVKGSIDMLQDLEVRGSVYNNDFIEFRTVFNPLMMKL